MPPEETPECRGITTLFRLAYPSSPAAGTAARAVQLPGSVSCPVQPGQLLAGQGAPAGDAAPERHVPALRACGAQDGSSSVCPLRTSSSSVPASPAASSVSASSASSVASALA